APVTENTERVASTMRSSDASTPSGASLRSLRSVSCSSAVSMDMVSTPRGWPQSRLPGSAVGQPFPVPTQSILVLHKFSAWPAGELQHAGHVPRRAGDFQVVPVPEQALSRVVEDGHADHAAE